MMLILMLRQRQLIDADAAMLLRDDAAMRHYAADADLPRHCRCCCCYAGVRDARC